MVTYMTYMERKRSQRWRSDAGLREGLLGSRGVHTTPGASQWPAGLLWALEPETRRDLESITPNISRKLGCLKCTPKPRASGKSRSAGPWPGLSSCPCDQFWGKPQPQTRLSEGSRHWPNKEKEHEGRVIIFWAHPWNQFTVNNDGLSISQKFYKMEVITLILYTWVLNMIRNLIWWDPDPASPGFKLQEWQRPRSDFLSHSPKLKCWKGMPHQRKLICLIQQREGGTWEWGRMASTFKPKEFININKIAVMYRRVWDRGKINSPFASGNGF